MNARGPIGDHHWIKMASNVCVSDHEWNVVSFTLALFDVAEKFGKYHVLIKNCKAFRDTLVWSMKKAGPKYAMDAEKQYQ